jgi:hypothetical protein
MRKSNTGISQGKGLKEWGVSDRGALGGFLGNPINQAGLVSLKVLEGDMGVN